MTYATELNSQVQINNQEHRPKPKQRQMKDLSQLQDEHEEIAETQKTQTKMYLNPIVTTTAKCGTTCIGVDENRIAFTLADCGSLLTKIPFSYRSLRNFNRYENPHRTIP